MSKSIIVAKFGGTSLADAAAIGQAAKVATGRGAALIVVSATGGTTDRLLKLAEAAFVPDRAAADRLLTEITETHAHIATGLRADADVLGALDGLFDKLRLETQVGISEHRLRKTDEILSFGEQLSSLLLLAAMRAQGADATVIDARSLIKTDGHAGRATPLIGEIAEQAHAVLLPNLREGKVVITQGFVGSSPDEHTTTLGRGGSDYSAALLAEAVQAEQLQIWTDVAGITSSDPRLVSHARRIEQMTFQEAAELATAGAKVLYPRTITPLRRAGIPLYVGSTFEPDAGGTLITNQAEHRPLVRAIALKTNQCLLTLTTPEMAQQFGYLARVFNVFADFKVSVDQISTSEIAISVAIEDQPVVTAELVQALEELGEVKLEKGLSVISVIGNGVNEAPGLAQDIFANLEEDGREIAVRMICQGASRHNFCFLVADRHGVSTVQRLHKAFIE